MHTKPLREAINLIIQGLRLILKFIVLQEKQTPVVSMSSTKDRGRLLFISSQECLDTDPSPDDTTPDGVACVDSAWNGVLMRVPELARHFSDQPQGFIGTWTIGQFFKKDERFTRVHSTEARPGDFALSITGEGDKATGITNGHIGIVMEGDMIASNDSRTGIWEMNYSHNDWYKRWAKIGEYPVYYFRIN